MRQEKLELHFIRVSAINLIDLNIRLRGPIATTPSSRKVSSEKYGTSVISKPLCSSSCA